MIKDYQAPTKEYLVVFCKEPFGRELSFPCDEDGNVDLTKFKEHECSAQLVMFAPGQGCGSSGPCAMYLLDTTLEATAVRAGRDLRDQPA